MSEQIDKTQREAHKERHGELHQMFDELVADFILHTGKLPSQTTLKELMDWSYLQTLNPEE